ncbi:MAG: hypothetical protein RMJ03_05450 [Nitrososphaerota archaeon]|nr:hypothetical protein [Nitrososphaerota archaeon]
MQTFIVLTVTGLLLSITGFALNNSDLGFFGVAFTFASVSAALSLCVRSDHPAKKVSEVVFMLGAFGTIFYGYFLTRSLLLGVLAVFIIIPIIVGVTLSYISPKFEAE